MQKYTKIQLLSSELPRKYRLLTLVLILKIAHTFPPTEYHH